MGNPINNNPRDGSRDNSRGHDPLRRDPLRRDPSGKDEGRYGYHIVLTTHNSRTSQRMKTYRVQKGPERRLSLKEEIILTGIISTIIKENDYKCLAYNICQDHVHMIIVCQEDALTSIVQKLKSVSSKLFHRHPDVDPTVTKLHSNRLWSQKFFRASLNEWTLAKLSNRPGELYQSSYLSNAMAYIENNRSKHQLVKSDILEKIIKGIVVSMDEAYALGDFSTSIDPLDK